MTQQAKPRIDTTTLKPEFIGLHILLKEDTVLIGIIDGSYTTVETSIPGELEDTVVSLPLKIDSKENKMYFYGSTVQFYDEFLKQHEGKELSTMTIKEYVEEKLDCPHRGMMLYELHQIVDHGRQQEPRTEEHPYGRTQEFIDFSKETYEFMKAHHFMLEEKAKAEAEAAAATEEESKPE